MNSVVAAVVLAAGASERFGSPKALAKIGEQTAIERLLSTIGRSNCVDTVVVLGADAQSIRSVVEACGFRTVMNANWRKGRTTSLQVGIEEIGDVACVAMFLVDHPFVTFETIEELTKVYASKKPKALRPVYNDRGGHPTFISSELFEEISKLSPDRSIREVLFKSGRMADHPVDDEGVVLSFNMIEELERIKRRAHK